MFHSYRVPFPVRRAFTLVEMLIVVVVLVTLMSITFRLLSVGSEDTNRAKTVVILQRVENCLSGYYAVFGTYPPVPLHAAQDINVRVNDLGTQDPDSTSGEEPNWDWYNESAENHDMYTKDAISAWEQVEAACRAQPVACAFPYTDGDRESISQVRTVYEKIQASAKKGGDKYAYLSAGRRTLLSQSIGILGENGNYGSLSGESDWREVQLFKFGLMSFLLPRYQVMMYGAEDLYGYTQWTENNELPADPYTGRIGTFDFKSMARNLESSGNQTYEKLKLVTTEAAPARWIKNLERICSCAHDYRFFGVDVRNDAENKLWLDHSKPQSLTVGSSRGYDQGELYYMDGVTVRDAWGTDLFYYSPHPYQSYILWSAGKNLRTYPPWITPDQMSDKERKCAAAWTSDDIIQMRN